MMLFLLLLSISFSLAENDLYSLDSLELQLKVDGSFELAPTKSGASVKEVSVDLLYYPQEDYRQELVDWKSEGTVYPEKVSFGWEDGKVELKEYGYAAVLKTKNERLKVQQKISYPLSSAEVQGLEEYLKSTATIDSDHPAIIAKASELAEGEDDLFKVVFNLASWVEENIEYDLNTVTSTASQKGSWVLENGEGVCDEMTTLFVAMARSLGIPARFVSGISYTNSEEIVSAVGSNWAGHGWAEIYFPEVGWVSFDVTFNQYGYIDVTHLKLRDGFDPTEPAVKYEWVSDGVDLQKGKLDLEVKVQQEGSSVAEEIILEQEILAHEVSFGSYNLVKGIVKNTANYYAATALNLAVPKEVEIIGRNRRNILLHPQEVRETYWIIKVPENLQENYIYTFPVRVYSEKNVSVDDSFTAQQDKNFYSKPEIEQLTVENEEKSYSRKVSFECEYQKEIKEGQEAQIICSIKNVGNANLDRLTFCLDQVCDTFDLPLNQKKSIEIKVNGGRPGWQKVIISAENDLVEKKTSLEYAVLDAPKITLKPDFPPNVEFGQSFDINLAVAKESFQDPQRLTLKITGAGSRSQWDIPQLTQEQIISLKVNGESLSWGNDFLIIATWEDKEGKKYFAQENIMVESAAHSFTDNLSMALNWVMGLFS